MTKTFDFKLANMRKPQNWIVVPASDEAGFITVQSDKSIGRFNPETGVGVLNTKGQYFMHLNAIMGAQPFTFPKEFIELAKANGWTKGEKVGGVMVIG